MGPIYATTTFIHTMNNSYSYVLDSGMLVFLDDIFMHADMVKEHFKLLKRTLACLYQYTFHCKLKKCSFLHNSTILLGLNVTSKGILNGNSKL